MNKWLNLGLIVSALFGYLEWGDDQHSFLFQVEYDLLLGENRSFSNFFHPFIALPLLGQALLLVTIFQKKPSKILTLIGLACLSLLLLFIFAIGVMSGNLKILASALPFLGTAILVLRQKNKVSNTSN